VLTATQIAAFVGVGLAGAAYVPQIWHLVRVHCAAGISRFAFSVWLGAALLVTTHAVATRAVVFILLGGVQIVATTVILLYGSKYASFYCRQPRSRRFRSRNEWVDFEEERGVSSVRSVTASTNRTGRVLTRAGERPEGGPGASFESRSPC
jgi:hypothetical protein